MADSFPNHLTKTDWVVETLRSEILRSVLEPGESLQQEEVARRLGVSSTPVREAFAVLESQGLVEKRPHRGVVVARMDANELRDVYEVRMLLEPRAFRRAAQNMEPQTIEQLQVCVDEATAWLAERDFQRCRRANSRFHEIIAGASGSETYSDVVRSLIRRSVFVIPVDHVVLRRIVGEHRGIVDDLRRGDIRSANLLMRDHLRDMTSMFQSGAAAGGTGTPRPAE